MGTASRLSRYMDILRSANMSDTEDTFKLITPLLEYRRQTSIRVLSSESEESTEELLRSIDYINDDIKKIMGIPRD